MTPDPRTVTVVRASTAEYPIGPPFDPSEAYPEYSGLVASSPNAVYAAVRDAFRRAGLDAARFGTASWNPLGELIHPGESVCLKPNLIREYHPRDPNGWRYVMTHGSVIRAVADYIALALDGRGAIWLADAPQTDSSFAKIVAVLGLDRLVALYRARGLPFELVDLRREEWVTRDAVVVARNPVAGDPRGAVAYNLADRSEFVGHTGSGRYYGADYDSRIVNRHHAGGQHEYLVAGSVAKADVVFSLPKLKTHKKAGITVSLKNLVGINADKNWLPHHTEGAPSAGGDEHPRPDAKHRMERRLVPLFRYLALKIPGFGPLTLRLARRVGAQVFGDTEEVVRSGNWHGNDTVWRMCLDLNKIVFYGDDMGGFRAPGAAQRKRHFVLVDGIIAGEGRGPMNPDPVASGIVVFGTHPASVDAACAWLMGFDPDRIPIVRQAFQCRHLPLAEWNWRDVELISDEPAWNGPLPSVADSSTFHFRPHFGWVGRVERSGG